MANIRDTLTEWIAHIQPGYSNWLREFAKIYNDPEVGDNGGGLCGEMTTIGGGAIAVRFGIPAYYVGGYFRDYRGRNAHSWIRVGKKGERYALDMTHAQISSANLTLLILQKMKGEIDSFQRDSSNQ